MVQAIPQSWLPYATDFTPLKARLLREVVRWGSGASFGFSHRQVASLFFSPALNNVHTALIAFITTKILKSASFTSGLSMPVPIALNLVYSYSGLLMTQRAIKKTTPILLISTCVRWSCEGRVEELFVP